MASYTPQQAEAALKPQLDVYLKAVDNEDWTAIHEFYHQNATLVQKDKECTHGNQAITDYLKKFAEVTGKAVGTISNPTYEGVGDYLIITANFSSDTEKAGVVKGKFLQIWKKEGDKHRVYHDEFEITA